MVATEWNDPHNGADDTKEFREWQGKQSPTPADLNSLAGRLDQQANEFEMGGGTNLPADLRAAARCVKAIASLERIIDKMNGYSVDIWKHKGLVRVMTYEHNGKGDSLIAAVEGAEVKP